MSTTMDIRAPRRSSQWLAYRTHLAEAAELRSLRRAHRQAVLEVLALRTALVDARRDRIGSDLAWGVRGLARGVELLAALRDALRAIIRDDVDIEQTIVRIEAILKISPCASTDSAAFDAEFDTAYPRFRARLIALYPSLTGKDLSVLVLLKTRITAADIATLLCISERSVRRHLLRIRRKMALAEDADIHDVLAQL